VEERLGMAKVQIHGNLFGLFGDRGDVSLVGVGNTVTLLQAI